MAPSQLPELELSPTAIFTRCKVCGGCEEKDKRFLVCSHSECFYKYYHVRCLTKEQIASDVQMGSQLWYCPSCLCRVCLCDTDDDKIILCDCCDQAYHLYCLSPPKTKVPTKYWDCDPCKKRKEKEKRILMLHRKDYDGDILKSTEIDGLDLLLNAAENSTGDKETEVATTTGK
ncbi:hypothetical protein BDA96_03G409500 [Sorghum bicolor]|nr:PHD finger protein EHD3 [Sorghum bicolor]XP_021312184.1 PHD finger protein EHD3 [Sorghum bicolor]XP_021312185.1 PHD finger protein EHD3 [Sorghum bicolor]XP_021312186.1 PHD finger protein EHD3 [Sorghum bicolor]KAG0540442.1 hypothetical protein BDA96_03G409500 [Sorghum bicolor]|eukprot:XP_002456750.1 PHD finger protein EHD3 [Sorghum bicolor]